MENVCRMRKGGRLEVVLVALPAQPRKYWMYYLDVSHEREQVNANGVIMGDGSTAGLLRFSSAFCTFRIARVLF